MALPLGQIGKDWKSFETEFHLNVNVIKAIMYSLQFEEEKIINLD